MESRFMPYAVVRDQARHLMGLYLALLLWGLGLRETKEFLTTNMGTMR